MRTLRKIASFPLKALHKTYGYIALAILSSLFIGGGIGAMLVAIALIAVVLLSGGVWVALFLLSVGVGGVMRHLIRGIDPEYAPIGKEPLENISVKFRDEDLRTIYKRKVRGSV